MRFDYYHFRVNMHYRDGYQGLRKVLDWGLSLIGIVSLGTLIAIVGFEIDKESLSFLKISFDIMLLLFIGQEAARFFIVQNIKEYFNSRKFEITLAILLVLNFLAPSSLLNNVTEAFPNFTLDQLTFGYLGLLQSLIVASVGIKVLRYNHLISKIKLHPGAIFALSFAFIILTGALFLMMPKATFHGISFIDALFTSTSAVCVTGLNAVDTPTTFTFLGRVIIMWLIQVGGLGVMTITTFFSVLITSGMSIGFRVMMKEFLSHDSMAEVNSVLKKIALITFTIEAIGAGFIYFSLGGSIYPVNPELFFSSIFHAVSAFCNAGFALYSDNLMSQTISTGYVFPTTVMCLIVLGGLGFHVISNIISLRSRKIARKPILAQLSPNSKLVIITTLCLIFLGGLLIWLTDSYTPAESTFAKIFHSVFFSVSARTAGFNTYPTELLSAAPVMFLIILMWIGASPASTGGGIKTTTFSIALVAFINTIRGKERMTMFKRQVQTEDIHRSFMIIFASLMVLAIGSVVLMICEPTKNAIDLIFEATSALGTVGLSRNQTFFIGTGGKTMLIILMYIGRIGALNFFLSFVAPPKEPNYTLPKAHILIG